MVLHLVANQDPSGCAGSIPAVGVERLGLDKFERTITGLWREPNMIELIIKIIIIWFLFATAIPYIIIPNLLFKTKIQCSEKLKKFSQKFKSKNKQQTLKNIYNYIIKNYKEDTYPFANFINLLNIPKLFAQNIEKIINKKQFLPCHVQNLVLITLLLNTGQFKKSDFKRKETITNFLTIHQYVIIKINNKKLKADPFFKILE